MKNIDTSELFSNTSRSPSVRRNSHRIPASPVIDHLTEEIRRKLQSSGSDEVEIEVVLQPNEPNGEMTIDHASVSPSIRSSFTGNTSTERRNLNDDNRIISTSLVNTDQSYNNIAPDLPVQSYDPHISRNQSPVSINADNHHTFDPTTLPRDCFVLKEFDTVSKKYKYSVLCGSKK
jgi:hypothetical protein